MAQKKIAEVRLEKQRQKHDSAEFVRGVLERHDVGRSGSRSYAQHPCVVTWPHT
jgi:hypothetical protein